MEQKNDLELRVIDFHFLKINYDVWKLVFHLGTFIFEGKFQKPSSYKTLWIYGSLLFSNAPSGTTTKIYPSFVYGDQ